MGRDFRDIEKFFRPFRFHLVGRVQNSRPNERAGCIYVFHNEGLFAIDQGGLMFRVQSHPYGGFEIILSPWKGVLPAAARTFHSLPPELCRHRNWKGLRVFSDADHAAAHELIAQAKDRYEAEFET
jgi:hypothetical protein